MTKTTKTSQAENQSMVKTLAQKIAEMKKLNRESKIVVQENGENVEAVFFGMDKKNKERFIAKVGEQGYSFHASVYVKLISDPKADRIAKKLSELKKLTTESKIKVQDGQEQYQAVFVETKRTKFLAVAPDGNTFEYPIDCYIECIELAIVDPKVASMQKEAKKWFGKTIQTSYGPSSVKGFALGGKNVALLEFGEEYYELSLENFLAEIKENN